LSRAAVFVLLIAVIVAPLAAQENYASGGARGRPAGCHEDRSNVPAPRPVSHSCCLGGHYPAIVQQGSTVRLPLRGPVQLVFLPHSLASTMLASSPNLMLVCGDPPIASPLRV
jgi:hypothetical protein